MCVCSTKYDPFPPTMVYVKHMKVFFRKADFGPGLRVRGVQHFLVAVECEVSMLGPFLGVGGI